MLPAVCEKMNAKSDPWCLRINSAPGEQNGTTMIWPFQKKKTSLRETQAFPPLSGLSSLDRQVVRVFFTKEDLLDNNVIFTEATIIETVSPEDSADPVFRDDFFYMCGKLQESPHPSMLKLLDFGSENGRLYRAWERRPLQLLSLEAATRGLGDEALIRSISEMFDGFLHLRDLGLSLSPALIHYLSIDTKGCFLVRLPFTFKSEFPITEHRHYQFQAFAHCPDDILATYRNGPLVSADIVFQFQLGILLWAAFSHQMPFRYPPGYILSRGLDFERQPFDFGPTLTPVLLRLTEPDSRKRYPTLEAAFEALRPGL